MLETQIAQTLPPVLVIEDDDSLRALFIALLTRAGFRVDVVRAGAEALQSVKSHPYTTVVLDLMPPRGDGFDFLGRLREARPAMLKRTVITTGVSERDLKRLDARGVFAVLRKPFDIEELVSTVRKCSRQSDTSRTPGGSGARGEQKWEARLEHSARRLECALPDLQKLLTTSAMSDRELMLRYELRRVVGQLGGAFTEAAVSEPDNARSDRYQTLGRSASSLAQPRPLRHDH